MTKEYLEALERLAMPDELHIEECKKLGIGLTEDYELIKEALLELKAIKEANSSEVLKSSVVLKFVVDLLKRYEGKTDYNIYITKDWLLEIKEALQRLEAIDNANPNEAMKELDEIIEYITEDKKVKYKATILFDCEIIKDALLKAQEQEKVLKIIFEKEVDIYVLRVASSVEHYNNAQDLKKLTQEEFDLLKRSLN